MEYSEYLQSIGQTLKWLRRENGVTQAKLAEATKLNYRHYQNIEAGRVNISIESLIRLSAFLAIDLPSFFRIVEEKPWSIVTKGRAKPNLKNWLELSNFLTRYPSLANTEDLRTLFYCKIDDIRKANRIQIKTFSFPVVEILEFSRENSRCQWANDSALDFFGPDIYASKSDRWFSNIMDLGVACNNVENILKNRVPNFYHEVKLKDGRGIESNIGVVGVSRLSNEGNLAGVSVACFSPSDLGLNNLEPKTINSNFSDRSSTLVQ